MKRTLTASFSILFVIIIMFIIYPAQKAYAYSNRCSSGATPGNNNVCSTSCSANVASGGYTYAVTYPTQWCCTHFSAATACAVGSDEITAVINPNALSGSWAQACGNSWGTYTGYVTYSPVAPAAPTGLNASCPTPGTTATVSWSPVASAASYFLKYDYLGNGWNGNCSGAYNSGDYCGNVGGVSSLSLGGVPGGSYGWSVYAVSAYGVYSTNTAGPAFTCQNPGTCGSAAGTSVSSTPSGTAACSVGTQSTVTQSGNNLAWTCAGVTSTASCSATASGGKCGTANGSSISSNSLTPSTACSSGTFQNVSQSGTTTSWQCNVLGSTSCSASMAGSSCGSLNGTTVNKGGNINNASLGLCAANNTLSGSVSGGYSWMCQYTPQSQSSVGYRKKITIDHTKVPVSKIDFPILVSLISDADLASNAASSGSDIYFTSSDGSTKLSYETEKFTKSTGEIKSWVKVPIISSTADTVIYMYYGSGVANTPDTTGVWTKNVGVYHLNEPVGASSIKDSTATGANGTGVNSPTLGVTGKIANGISFNGTNAAVTTSSTFGLTNINITLSCWVNLSSASLKGPCIKMGSSNGFGLGVGGGTFDTAGNHLVVLYEGVRWIDTGVNIGTGWHMLALVVDASGKPTVYLDGVSAYTDTSTAGIAPTVKTSIGGYTSGYNRYLAATIDEVRISNTPFSSDRIALEYKNQTSLTSPFDNDYPNALFTYDSLGAEEPLSYSYTPPAKQCNATCAAGTTYSASANSGQGGCATTAAPDGKPGITLFKVQQAYGSTCPVTWTTASLDGGPMTNATCNIDGVSQSSCYPGGSGTVTPGLHTFTIQTPTGGATSSIAKCLAAPQYREK